MATSILGQYKASKAPALPIIPKKRAVPLPPPPARRQALSQEARLEAERLRQAQQRQIRQYEKAVKYFHGRKFVRALSFFDQVGEGPNDALRNRARVYAQICRSRREARKARLKTADDHYNYAVKLDDGTVRELILEPDE